MVVIQSLYVAVATRFFRHRLRPVVAWLAADRGETGAVAAWEAAASLPAWWFGGLMLAPVLVTCPAGALLIVWQLDLPARGFAIVLAGALVVSIYAISMLFVVIEWALNPLLADLSDHLPSDAELHPTGVPVRSRLLVALPAINVVAGVFVASVARSEGAELNDLGVVILVSVAAAVTLSLWFTVLLSRSLVVPIGELRTATERVRRGDLEARVPILSADETGELAQSFNRMVVGPQERERLGEAFRRVRRPRARRARTA